MRFADGPSTAIGQSPTTLNHPTTIARHGGSYGGAISIARGALRNRTPLPDGSLIP